MMNQETFGWPNEKQIDRSSFLVAPDIFKSITFIRYVQEGKDTMQGYLELLQWIPTVQWIYVNKNEKKGLNKYPNKSF
jgi:hypothetical protein